MKKGKFTREVINNFLNIGIYQTIKGHNGM